MDKELMAEKWLDIDTIFESSEQTWMSARFATTLNFYLLGVSTHTEGKNERTRKCFMAHLSKAFTVYCDGARTI